jgi:hypothetical protein
MTLQAVLTKRRSKLLQCHEGNCKTTAPACQSFISLPSGRSRDDLGAGGGITRTG